MWPSIAIIVGSAIALACLLRLLDRSRTVWPSERARERSARAPARTSLSANGSSTPLGDEDLTFVARRADLPIPANALLAGTPARKSPEPQPVSPLLADMLREARDAVRDEPIVVPIGGSETASQAVLLCNGDAVPDEKTGPVALVVVSACADSDRGKMRARNEDSYLLLERHGVFVVADGMGGHEGGSTASALAVQSMQAAFERGDLDCASDARFAMPRRARELACAVLSANRAVFDAARADPSLADMGTTLLAARFAPEKQRVYVGHVGDSRCYRLRDGKLDQLTADHTMAQLGIRGATAGHLSRAIGIDQDLLVDVIVDRPRPDDLYLLCTDGLSKMVPDGEIRRILLEDDNPESALYGLIEQANDAGGKDNITVVLLSVTEPPQLTRPNHPPSRPEQQL